MRSARAAAWPTSTRKQARVGTCSSSSSRPTTRTSAASWWRACAERRYGDEGRSRAGAARAGQAPDNAPARPVRGRAGGLLRDPLRPGLRAERRPTGRDPARPFEGCLPGSADHRLARRGRAPEGVSGQLPWRRHAPPPLSVPRPRHPGGRRERRAGGLGRGRGRQAHDRRQRDRGERLMFTWYLVFKFLHILAAIVAVGLNITYGVWSIRASNDPAQLGFALKGVKFLDDRIANPAYGVLLVTGLVMVFMQWKITALWIVIALILFAAIVVLGVAVYSPLLKNQIRLVEAGQTYSPVYAPLAGLRRRFGPGLGIIVLVILVMMVFKPSL